ncbi:CBL-interacting serine/threonine-protein kinase 11, partial [Cucurbita argyrosperma subsp. argyrosperma]
MPPFDDNPPPRLARGESLPEGILFGKYELGKLLGCGVLRRSTCRNVLTGQSVAIKIRRRRRFYFVMEFAKGGELFGKVSKGRFSENLSRRYFQQLITAFRDFGLSALTDQIRPDGLLHTLCELRLTSRRRFSRRKATTEPKSTSEAISGALNGPRQICGGFSRGFLDTNPETRITVDEIHQDPWFVKGFQERSSKSKIPLQRFTRGEKTAGGAKVEGLDGGFIAVIDIFRLTEELVVLRLKNRVREVDQDGQIWKIYIETSTRMFDLPVGVMDSDQKSSRI